MKIVCGTNFSVHANEAALAAAALVARANGTLTLVHVLDSSRYTNPSKDLMDHLRAGCQRELNSLIERVKRRAAKVEARIVEGSPALRLAEVASEIGANLIVVSANGQIAPTKWYSGSVTDQVVQRASIPTLVLRDASAFKAWVYEQRPLKILVGYDFSVSADAALRWTRSLREIVACDVTVVYVASAANERARLGIAPPMSPLYYPSGTRKFLEAELKQKCDLILGDDGTKFCVKADWGRPDSQLIEIARDDRMDLIVVGTSQRRGLARLGSISRAVSHYAHMNVACVPIPVVQHTVPATFPQFNRVLVPIDLTDSADQAITLAYTAVREGGDVQLLHVVTPSHLKRSATLGNRMASVADQEASTHLKALVPEAAAIRGITTHVEVVEHHEPGTAICQAADRFDADLICLGSRKRSQFRETIFGSVSQEVLAQSGRAVFVLRGKERKQCTEVMKNKAIVCGG